MQRKLLAATALMSVFATSVAIAQPAPSDSHPRLWLDAATQSGIEAQGSVANSAVARGASRCAAARANPSSYAAGGWQGFEFVTTLSGCLISWVASHDSDDLTTAIKYWNVLLDDYQTVGDGLGGDTVVTHDTGYAMRTFAPYSALAYDWLHDAPGVTEELRSRSRARFDAWINFYSTSGYLRDMPGANYQAGYLFAATLIAIAEGGEAGAAGDAHWAIVRDTIWGDDMAAALVPSGALDGGDWPEGWQYGPLSVLEYALAARAMEDNGVPIAGIERWASSLVLRFAHGLTPTTRKAYPAGDSDDAAPNREPVNGALLAAIAGPASDGAKAWARALNVELELTNENPLFDALAAASSGPTEPLPADSPTNYVAAGSGNFYARGAWTNDTAWSVFQCSRRLVDDHQHNNAGNWVLTRGADDVVVDPSPYGTLSTLTGNAPAVDSASLPASYSPSQGNWGETTELVWARQSTSGVAVARCDYADQFRRSDVPSDVAHAVRDFAFVPNGGGGTVVLVDRVVTGSSSRGMHLRVRTPAAISLSADLASGTLGDSALAIQRLWSTSGTPSVRDMPRASECSSSNRTCDISRLPSGMEYRLDVAGPSAFAIHVIDARAGDSSPSRTMLSGNGYRGVLLGYETAAVAVVTNGVADGALASSLVYRVPAGSGTVHAVVNAPVGAEGRSAVTSTRAGADCEVLVTPHEGGAGGYPGRPLLVRTSADCTVTDDGTQPPLDPGGTGGAGGTPGTGGTAGTPGGEGGDGPPEGGTGASDGGSSPGTGGTATGGSSAGTNPNPGHPEPTQEKSQGCALAPSYGSGGGLALFGAGALGLLLRLRRRRTDPAPSRPRWFGSFRSACGGRSSRETRP